ncbi:MAG: hypothetical protein GX885_08535, partial [Methanomicrobiales archaeon]|nr:hypothetical protein [Methanomicrobiales archaeon]
MLFDTLVLTCLCHGTSYSESGKRIRVERKPGERIAFFDIDENSNRYSAFRRDFGVEGPICDLIIFYSPHDSKDCTKVLCFAELKGTDVRRALDQIRSTYQAVKDKVPPNYRDEIRWKGYILMRGSAPRVMKRYKAELNALFGHKNSGDISTTEDV